MATLPHLARSSLHRCLQRHGISRLSDVEGGTPGKRTFKTYPFGYFPIDIAEVRTEQGKLYLLVAIDRTSKFAFVAMHEKATTRIPADFLRSRFAKSGGKSASAWLLQLLERKPRKLAAVALANEMARIVWTMMLRGPAYRRQPLAA